MTLLLQPKKLPISTGGRLEVHLHPKDAERLRAQSGTSLRISVADMQLFVIAETSRTIAEGTVGICKEAVVELLETSHTKKTLPRAKIHVQIAPKPESLEYIKKKLHGKHLSAYELDVIDRDIVSFALSDVEACYFISACYANKLSIGEAVNLTRSMVDHGEQMNLRKKLILDKHCIGGVPGNRTSLAIIPLMVALGYTIPKTSSRSITSPSGTADTVETIAEVELTMKEAEAVVKKTGGCVIWGGGTNVAPSDDRMINIRHSMHLDPEGLLLSSIMAKKAAMGSKYVLIDLPYGPQAKMKNKREAAKLARKFEKIGGGLGMKMATTLSVGDQPVGFGVGPALEMRDVLRLLSNDSKTAKDYKLHALDLASVLVQLVEGGSKRAALERCKEALESGKALEAFSAMMRAQGLKFKATKVNFLKKAFEHIESLIGSHTHDVVAPKTGILRKCDIKKVAAVAFVAGSPADSGAGVEVYKKLGEKVRKGEVIMKLYSNSVDRLQFAVKELETNYPFEIK